MLSLVMFMAGEGARNVGRNIHPLLLLTAILGTTAMPFEDLRAQKLRPSDRLLLFLF